MKKMFVVLFSICMAACSGSNQNNGGGSSGGNAGGDGQGGASAPSLKAKSKAGDWQVKSVLAIVQGGFIALYFAPNEGIDCSKLADVASLKDFVSLTIPEKVQKVELKDSVEIAKKSMAGVFVESNKAPTGFENLKLDLRSTSPVAGHLEAQGSNGELISGDFQAATCRF